MEVSAALCEHETRASGQRAAKPASIANFRGRKQGDSDFPLRLKPLCSLWVCPSRHVGRLGAPYVHRNHRSLARPPDALAIDFPEQSLNLKVLCSLWVCPSRHVGRLGAPYVHRNHRTLHLPLAAVAIDFPKRPLKWRGQRFFKLSDADKQKYFPTVSLMLRSLFSLSLASLVRGRQGKRGEPKLLGRGHLT